MSADRIYIFDRSGHIVWTSERKEVNAMVWNLAPILPVLASSLIN